MNDHEVADAAEARATRRRWISLAEIVGVAGLIIAAFSLWLSWSDRREAIADKQVEQTVATRHRALVTLTGDVNSDGDTIRLADTNRVIDTVTVAFPTALGVSPQSSLRGPLISVGWFDSQLQTVTKDANAGRLPVLLTTAWWDGDIKQNDAGIYDVAWERKGKFFGGHKVVMLRLTLHTRTASQAALDATWAAQKPARR